MVAKLAGGAGGVHALAFNPNSRQLTTASADGVLRLWDVPGGKLHSSIGKPGDPGVNCVAYSSDSSYLVAGLADGTVAAWNSSSREPIFRSQVHGAGVKCLAFTPDGSRLMTAAADQSLKVFDPATWRELLTLYLEDSAGGMSFSPDGKRLALATGSLIWLETEAEVDRTQQRRLAREAEQRATSLLQEIFGKTNDELEGRKQILAKTTSDEVLRRVSLRVLQVVLTNAAYQAYQAPKLDEQVALELLRQQILLDKGGHATAAQKEQLLAGIKARLVLPSIQRQALVEYATAVTNWEILHGTAEQAWEIVADPKRSADDQLVVYFGLEPQKWKAPQSANLLKILAGAEYRVGLYSDALESAQKGLTLSTEDKPASAHLLAVVAMAQHRSGQAAQAVETVKQLDNLLQDSTVKTDKIAMALSQESRVTLAAPLDKPWDDEAAIATCQERMKKLQLDEAKIAAWAAKSAARRHIAKGDIERAATAFGSALGAAKDRATKANLITDAGRLPGVLERLAELTPSDGMLQAELARRLNEQGNLAAANAARVRAVQSIEGELAKDSENVALAADLADVLLIEATPWTILKPSNLTSQGGETMTVEPDGSIFVSGPTPDRAVYTLTFPTDVPTLGLLRLETIPDARLPSGGAGRTSHGNFHVSELTAAIESEQPGAKPTPIDFGLAMSDDQSNPQLSLDRDSQTIWDTWPNHLQPHWAVFAAKSPVPLEGSTLTITLDSGTMHGGKHGLGRFRLSVCEDPTQIGKEQKRIAAMKIADPWAKLGAAYALAGNIERASDLFAKSGLKEIGASLESGHLTDEVLDAMQTRHPQLYASVLPGSASAAAERGQVEQARSQYEQLAKLQPEQSRWKERAEQLQPGVLAAWNFDSSLGGWGDARNCDVSIKDGVLTARTTAPDPQFSKRLSSSAGGKAVVLRYRSSEAFTMQIFWAEASGGFDDVHRLDYPIPAATGQWSEIALPFWCQQDLNALRLDPNTISEHPLEIDSLVLRRAEPDEYQQAVKKVLIEPELARLTQDIAANPMSAPVYAARATFLIRLGRWREAADDFEQERKLAQPDRLNYFKVSNCRLLAGDVAGHQQLCREMVAQFRETSDANVADSVCKICLLGPSEINLTKLPITLLREATSDPQQKDNRHWFVACCALIAYREGNYEKSVDWTKEMPEFKTQSGALALVVRALAEQRLGQVDQARETLAQAETVIPPELRGLGAEGYVGPLPASPGSVGHDWLAPEILRREAEKLIRGKAASQP
jgi:tetratricopeptide (TPR) repeat protein